MLGRSQELKNLNTCYEKDGSCIFVLYGQKHLGIRTLLDEFCADKAFHYYAARPCSEREQLYQWGLQLLDDHVKIAAFPSYSDIFTALLERCEEGKFVLVIDEFSHIVKNSEGFMDELVQFVKREGNHCQIMVILVSSAIGWIENNMVEKIGKTAYRLSGLIKIRELSFYEMVRHFSNFTVEQCIEAYAILGGYPELWEYFDDRLSIKENIINTMLKPGSYLRFEAVHAVEEYLRETNVYNTILVTIASGKDKLNDLYEHTGFSRAKISVYLKNLMELELVEKVFSYDAAGKENVQKGIYRISNKPVHFYFSFIFPHLSDFGKMSAVEFYKTHIAPGFKRYVDYYFKKICMQNLELRNAYRQLPFVYDRSGEWAGKVGNIDMIAQDGDGNTLVCLCNWEKPMTYEDYEWLLFCMEKAKVEADYIYLFSGHVFDEKLNLEAKIKKNLKLIPVSEL